MYGGPVAVSSEGDISVCQAREEMLAWEGPAQGSSKHIGPAHPAKVLLMAPHLLHNEVLILRPGIQGPSCTLCPRAPVPAMYMNHPKLSSQQPPSQDAGSARTGTLFCSQPEKSRHLLFKKQSSTVVESMDSTVKFA